MIKQCDIEYIVGRLIGDFAIAFAGEGKITEKVQDKAVAFVRERLTEAGASLQRERVAIVEDPNTSAETVNDYLPQGYKAKIEYIEGRGDQLRIVIRGYDLAGWTLDDYVIPRLASGLIVAKEVA